MESSKSSTTGWSLLGRWLLLLTGGYVVLCLFLAFIQRRMQYFPYPNEVSLPREERYRDLEDVTLETLDGLKVRAWYWPGRRPVTLVIFHGNAGNREHRLWWIEGFHRRGLGIFLLDYRGYGGSEGSPSEEGLYLDAEAAVAWLEKRGAGKQVLFGESLGSGVAVEMAVRHRPAGLIIQSGFSSAVDVARRHYPYLPVGLFLKDRYENLGKIEGIACPSLFIHGERDRIVPVELGRRLYERAPEPKKFCSLPADHNDLVVLGGGPYFDAVDGFVKRHVEQEE